jgi:hypothetical protein
VTRFQNDFVKMYYFAIDSYIEMCYPELFFWVIENTFTAEDAEEMIPAGPLGRPHRQECLHPVERKTQRSSETPGLCHTVLGWGAACKSFRYCG